MSQRPSPSIAKNRLVDEVLSKLKRKQNSYGALSECEAVKLNKRKRKRKVDKEKVARICDRAPGGKTKGKSKKRKVSPVKSNSESEGDSEDQQEPSQMDGDDATVVRVASQTPLGQNPEVKEKQSDDNEFRDDLENFKADIDNQGCPTSTQMTGGFPKQPRESSDHAEAVKSSGDSLDETNKE